ncbi:hypothetical protein [Streptomyces camelliae]|uniref:Uncharacterized protein n=1 Tax=Streptomyces camelliae TaxID=3004093 RepID=A0ABY7P1Q4_9ACTN|nr:hypothetical protein [Streptomyces sp. HUAS 2-6]WBO64430.1 hypothetical protein O1G22_17095 [Streptomyces sp. HUAS 2-6]
MSTVPPPDHPEESSIPDEQWEAFLREAVEEGGRNAPKEPSARARMVTRRLREQDEATRLQVIEGGGRRRWWQRKRVQEPQGWRTGPAWREMNGRNSRRRTVGSVIGVVLAVALAVIAVRPSLLLDRLPGRHHTSSAPLPAETALPSSAPGGVGQAGLPTLKDPFRGSPALRWAEGADAIEVPQAKAVGGMSQEDVALALRRTKEFLVGTNLDPAVLRGGQPDAALALLDPRQPHTLSDLRRSLRTPDRDHDPLHLVTRFDPSEVALAGDVVKVRGHMTFSAGAAGEVRVHADYTFVYPLVRAGGKGGGDVVARTIIRRDLTMVLLDPSKWIATEGKLGIRSSDSEFYNSECGVYDGYYHPVFPDSSPTGAPATGPTADPYDRSKSLTDDHHKGCGTVSRT